MNDDDREIWLDEYDDGELYEFDGEHGWWTEDEE